MSTREGTGDLRTTEAVVAFHEQRRSEAADQLAVARAADGRVANARLLVAGVVLTLAIVAATTDLSWLWTLLPVAGFVPLVAWHARTARAIRDAERRDALHALGLARLDGTWPGHGPDGARFADPEHPFCDHLDVFGKGSLFQLVSVARTPQGEARLAAWLKAPAAPGEIRARQQAVAELRPRRDLREDVALLGADAATAAGLQGLPAWGEAPTELAAPWIRVGAWLLPVPTFVALGAWIAGAVSFWWVVLFFAVSRLAVRSVLPRVGAVLAGVEAPARDLELLRGLVERIEASTFETAALRGVTGDLVAEGATASARIRSLSRRIAFGDARRNQLFAPFAIALLWEVHAALLLEAWRTRCGPHLRAWVDAVARFEALSSLAGYAADRPEDPFPEIVDEGPVFVAEGAAHPLLRRDRAVRNDLRIDAESRVYVVSGSNMSGKSTMLRTVGTNIVLALAGAPVRARALTVSPVTVGASIHVHDSLLDGESRFYAEVARIGRIVELGRSGQLPLLFLLDEIFHGTNSADRRTGAAAVVRTLLDGGAAGLVTTHDLELARLAEDLDAHVVNVHFEDQFEEGRMSFDYRMRPGVVERSNALALMRAVGLDV